MKASKLYKIGDWVTYIGSIKSDTFVYGHDYQLRDIDDDDSNQLKFVRDSKGNTMNGWCMNFFTLSKTRIWNDQLKEIINNAS